jgi:putative protease
MAFTNDITLAILKITCEAIRNQTVANVGDVTNFDESSGMAEVLVKNRFQIGDRLEIIHPSGNRIIKLAYMQDLDGKLVSVAPGNGYRVKIPLTGNIEKALVARFL